MKVFGVGLNKTGTSTFGKCMEVLGYTHVSYRSDLLQQYLIGRIDPIIVETKRFDSFEDWPWPLLYERLYEEYKDQARYVLTVRISADVWLKSLKKHCLNTDPDRPMRAPIYGYKYPHGYEREHMIFYERHNSNVRKFFSTKASHLFTEICWEKGDGWPQLCSFLNVPIPAVPLPHIRPRETGVSPLVRERNLKNIKDQLRSLKLEDSSIRLRT